MRIGDEGSLVIRSAFSSLPVEHLSAPPTPGLRRLFACTRAYARFLLDVEPNLGE